MMKKFIYTIIAIALLSGLASCDKDVLDPTLAQQKDILTSINTHKDLEALIRGTLNRMTTSAYYGRDIIIIGSIRSDDAYSDGKSGRFNDETKMGMVKTHASPRDLWVQIYRVIATCNIIINTDLSKITGDPAVINHFVGQAYALRALAHYDLLRIYGQQHVTGGGTLGIPYVKTYKGDAASLLPARNTVAECKTFIMADLAQASTLMSASLNHSSKQYMTTYGANALAARVALYFEDWATAKTQAGLVISSGKYSVIAAADYAKEFINDGGANSIFELAYSTTDHNGIDGLSFIYRGSTYGDIRALPEILNIFEPNDVRGGSIAGGAMIGYEGAKLRNLGKYPSSNYSDNINLIRYEEVVLIYAEACFQLGETATALTYLNMVPAKRGASPYLVASKANILLERRRELCFEGFRFDDIARTRSGIQCVAGSPARHGNPAYGSYNYAFPIPQDEMLSNSNMVQNIGYN